jgi:hypothetical protein
MGFSLKSEDYKFRGKLIWTILLKLKENNLGCKWLIAPI